MTNCDYCQNPTDPEVLFTHEPTSHQLCQECLAKFLQTDIADSGDHRGRFQGWEFYRYDGRFCAENGDAPICDFDMENVLGRVLHCIDMAETHNKKRIL